MGSRLTIVAAIVAALTLALGATPAAAGGDREDDHRDRGRGDRWGLDATDVVYTVDEESLPFEPLAGHEDSERHWGVLRGAGWRVEVPADWNGDLVMWAHGFRGSGTRLFFNAEEVPFRQWLLDNGYAWAASTYSRNDYNVGTAVIDTRRLLSHTRQVIGHRPDRVFIAGASMGGHVTAESVERYPHLYDGAMPVCGVVGDYELFDFFLDFNLAAQQLALGTSQFPPGDDYATTTAQDIKRALEAAPDTWPVALNEQGEAFKQLVELRSGGDRPNFDEAWLFWNSVPNFGSGIPGNFLFDLGAGDGTIGPRDRVAVSNRGIVYETDLVPGLTNPIEEALNAEVVRVRPEWGGRADTPGAPSPRVSGRIRVPVLTMHNLGDLFVPFHMETEYHAAVSRWGREHLLVQRAIRGSGHCDFTTAEYEQGFADLVAWVETGERPEGDAVGDPSAVAADDFGCRFTDPADGAHLAAAACSVGP